jgi:hypothetical protein
MRSRSPILAVFLLTCLSAAAQQDAPSAAPANSSTETPPSANSSDAQPSGTPVLARERPDLTPGANGQLSQEQMRELTRIVAQNYRDNYKKQRDYTYIERDVEKSIGGNGQVKSTETKTYEIIAIYGEQVRRLIEKDDKPLDVKEAAKEEERIQKIVDKHKNESEDDRKKRLEKEAKRREESRKFVTEVADSHDFRVVGTELVDGREAWIIDGVPRPGYEPQDKEANFVSKFRGRLWIDKDDLQLAKMDIEAVDTASVGWVLARIHKGTRVIYEQMRMNDEIWLPQHLTYKFDARVALFKGYNVDGEQTYRDYKKFRTSSKIVGIGAVQEPK